jgi:hypothetical protein
MVLMGLSAAEQALRTASSAGGRLVDLVRRENQGAGQACPWDLVVSLNASPQHRAAAAWIVADEIMKSRTGISKDAYALWRGATPTIEVIRDGQRIATVPADHHLDVLAALDSGLELQHAS